MKKIKIAFTLLIAIVCLLPMAAAVLDLWCWLLFDHKCTPLDWERGRLFFALLWTVISGRLALAVGSALLED